ncbi:calcium-binding protein [Limimaricola hongkongensis]|uniref:Alkaline phosphatase n=1 Tax=Limimaricola hongkongensis DSM 17492 TaxID=1122180 RepID=A0A017H7U5_9RHOB|nr:calcium-binding protein [Limimaricola hongkongensis]EYD70547.1 Alkaline phosphatase [Limimaricola hongkongensis DSM 17492]
MSFITSDVCEEVEICDENEIVQDCLPSGDDLVCEYTITLYIKDYADGNLLNKYMSEGQGASWMGWPVAYQFKKMVNTDGSEYWHAIANGTNGDDLISGLGLLNDLEHDSAATKPYPSVYVGDLVHFDINGHGGDDKIEGAHNADVLKGGSGDDHIKAHGGDDMVYGGTGDDEIEAGDGNDLVWGNEGNDTIDGGAGHDQLDGADGNDDVSGGDGNDNITGGAGNDLLKGDAGNDHMLGNSGNDEMYGGDGDDCMAGGDDNDRMYGDGGNDLMTGNLGNDVMYGGDGNDKLDGNEGNDWVHGDGGNDLVVGGAGDDHVYGGDGDDIVRGGIGDDEMWGGEGCDQFVFCEVDFNCSDIIWDFDTRPRGDQIDLTQIDIDTVRVQTSGLGNVVGLDLIVDGETVQQIEVNAYNMRANIESVFERDSTFGTDEGAMVQIGAGVRVDLPSVSVLHTDGGMFF